MQQRILAVAFILLLLSAAAVLYRAQRDDGGPGAADSPLPQDYDYTISNMQLHSFTPDGVLQYQLESERVTHYPSPDHSVLENPMLHWYEPGKPEWVLTSLSGDLRADDSTGETRLLLQQDVVARRSSTDGATLDARGESLVVLPDTGELSSSDPIQVHSGNTQLSGSGMQAWLRENRIKLAAGSGRHE